MPIKNIQPENENQPFFAGGQGRTASEIEHGGLVSLMLIVLLCLALGMAVIDSVTNTGAQAAPVKICAAK